MKESTVIKNGQQPLHKRYMDKSNGNELYNNVHGHKANNTPGTITVIFLDHILIKNISADEEITYACIIVDCGLQTKNITQIE